MKELEQANLGWLWSAYEVVSNLLPLLVILSLPIAAMINLVRQSFDPSPEWSSALGLLIASLVPAGLAAWRFKYQRARRRKILDSAYPQLLILGESGIETQEHGGKVLFAEWGYYSGFLQGKAAFFLKMAGKRKYRTIPFDTLQLEQQGQMRAIILNHLPEIQES